MRRLFAIGGLLFSTLGEWANPLYSNLAYVTCHGESFLGQTRWNWAESVTGTFLRLRGRWEDRNNDKVFITDEILEGDISERCVQTLEFHNGPGFRLSYIKASPSLFFPKYEIEFQLSEDKKLRLHQVATRFNSKMNVDFGRIFLERMKAIMRAPDYPDILSQSVYYYYAWNFDLMPKIEPYLREANRYETLQDSDGQELVKGGSEIQSGLVLDFLAHFRGTSDYEILSYQFDSDPGVKRGLFNSYVDLVTDEFKPNANQDQMDAPKLYNPFQAEHRWTYALIQAFSSFASLRGILSQIDLVQAQKGNEDVLTLLLQLYVKEASRCMTDLYRLEQEIPMNRQDWFSIVDQLRLDLLKKRSAIWL